jgi:GNAT superfamily N-acetyltransferase
MANFQIRTMRLEDLQMALDWARLEGWNPGLNDSTCFHVADPNGFFVGELDGEPIVVASQVNYDSSYSFFGIYIVKPAYRGQGYGMRMTRHCMSYCGNRNAGLDGVIENIQKYQKNGFKSFCLNQRFMHIGLSDTPLIYPNLVPLSSCPFDLILKYDRECFFSERPKFLQHWINQPDSTALGFMVGNQLQGFGVCRKCHEGHKIGPLFADDVEVANELFLALQSNKSGERVFLDIPEINNIGQHLVKLYGFVVVFSAMRMYTHGLPNLANEKIVGVTTLELG